MKLVWKNIRNLFLKQKRFALLILLTQVAGTFAVCFTVGVLYNNQYIILEDENSTMELGIYFSADNKKCIYENVQKTMEKIYGVFGDALEQVQFEYFQYEEEVLTFASVANWDGTAYHANDFFEEYAYQIYEGRTLTEEDFEKQNPVAVVSGSYKADTVQAYGKEFELVGRRMKDDTLLPMIWIPVTCWEGIPVHYVALKFTRIPAAAEYKRVCEILEKDFSGEYEISDYYAGSADYQALYRTLSIAVGGIMLAVLGTLLMLYGYVYETRRFDLTVMKLCGCRHMQAAIIYTVENVLIAVPACTAGLLFFSATRTLGLDKAYPYIKDVFNAGMYLLCIGIVLFVVFLEAVILSALMTYGSVKDQMRRDKA